MVRSIAVVPALAAFGAALDLRQWGGSYGPSGFGGGSSSWSVSETPQHLNQFSIEHCGQHLVNSLQAL